MKKIFATVLMTFSLHCFVLSAPFTATKVFETRSLPKLQSYQNNPPSGYLEMIRCKKGWKFILVEGEFDAEAKIKGKQISLRTVSGETHYPVGCVMENGIPFLDYRGYTKGYEKGMGMVFAVPDSEKAHSLSVLSESVALPAPSEKGDLTLAAIPEIEILETARSQELNFDYKLTPADKDWVKGALDNFQRVVTPVNGDILTVTMNIKVSDEFDIKELSVFTEYGFSSTPIGYESTRSKRLKYFGSIRSSGEYSFMFITPKTSEELLLCFRNRVIHNLSAKQK